MRGFAFIKYCYIFFTDKSTFLQLIIVQFVSYSKTDENRK